MLRTNCLIALAALALTQVTWASSDLKIKFIGPSAEDPAAATNPDDDRIVAVFSYEKLETTQLCGGKMGPTTLSVTVHADGTYAGVETASRLRCANSGLVRKALYSKHDGRLSMTDLSRLWERLGEMTQEARDLASAPLTIDKTASYETHIRRSRDLRGVQSVGVQYLPEVVQNGQAALASVRFMQAFVLEGKIN